MIELQRTRFRLARALKRRWEVTLPFTRKCLPGLSRTRALMLTHDNPVCHSQIYPFHFYRGALRARYKVEFRERSISRFLARKRGFFEEADIVLVQPWFTLGGAGIDRLLDEVERRCRPERIIFLDAHAPTDLRFAKRVNDRVAVYVKKHVLRDRTAYGRPTRGDTTLTDYFAPRHGIELPEVAFEVPPAFFSKMLIGPSFATAEYMLGAFLRGELRRRPMRADVHARLGREGAPWYSAMRREAIRAAEAIEGARVLLGKGVSKDKYLAELEETRLCFSPFGYGEVAFRDYEAVMCGSLLLKPDVSHIVTEPDIFVPGETYVPLRWDLCDLDEQAQRYLHDEDARARLTQNAFRVLREYFAEQRFVTQMARVFG
jgi:Glycosyl transferases group 1